MAHGGTPAALLGRAAALGSVERIGRNAVAVTANRSGRSQMKSFTPFAVLLALSPTMVGCTEGGASEPEVTQAVAVAASTGATASARPRRSTSRSLDPTQTNIHPRATTANPNVDVPIPFDGPANPVLATGLVNVPVPAPGTVNPALPLGAGPQRPASNAASCTSAPALKLACSPDAPTPSTCTAGDNLPARCHAMTVPGALYPDNAIPACCS